MVLLGATVLAACSDLGDPPTDPDPDKNDAPVVAAVMPDSGAVGDTVSISGTDFGDVAGSVMLGAANMTIVSWNDLLVRSIVPEGAVTGSIRLLNAGGTSNAVSFRVGSGGGGGHPLPVISDIVPLRTVVGDTLWLNGTGFGTDPGDLRVELAAASGRVEAPILSWADTQVLVEIPQTAVAGLVTVTDGDRSTEGIDFDVAPELISFGSDLLNAQRTQGLFVAQGCSACHFDRQFGNNGFSVGNPTDIRAGGIHGPAAVPRHAEQSLIIRVLKGIEPGIQRMPQGGEMPAAQIRIVEDWINQGMRDN
ncbi:MAG: IPT/TIG domain-containing protein [Candidatus Eisenbacteria bacterium]